MIDSPQIYKLGKYTGYLLFSVHYGDGREASLDIPYANENDNDEDLVTVYRQCLQKLLEDVTFELATFLATNGPPTPVPYSDGRVAYLGFPIPGPSDEESFTSYIQEFKMALSQALSSGRVFNNPPQSLA